VFRGRRRQPAPAMSGRQLYDLRMSVGLSQARLAALIGFKPLAVCRWENNRVPISADRATKIKTAVDYARRIQRRMKKTA